MIRKIITIDEEKCNGCNLCVSACHEGAIALVNGKAKLMREDYCDGLGDCLPSCPTGAITFEEREAEAYDQAAVLENMEKQRKEQQEKQAGVPHQAPPFAPHAHMGGCPGSNARSMHREKPSKPAVQSTNAEQTNTQSELQQWPVQIKLVAPNAPYFENAKLLIAADCTAFAYRNFHQDFIKNHVTLIGCPKLDEGDYADKLTEIIKNNNIKSVTVVRMEVPCCGGIENAVKQALQNSGKMIPWQVATVSIDGELLEN